MSALRRVLPLGVGETVASWASRLALMHKRRLFAFCADMKISVQAILDGDREVLAELAHLGGESEERLLAASVVRTSRTSYSFNGQRLTLPMLRRERLCVCPACLREDVERGGDLGAFNRLLWTLAPIRTCANHGMSLVDLGGCGNPHMTADFAYRVAPTLGALESVLGRSAPRAASPMEHYLTERLDGGGKGGLLDGFAWHVAAKTCEMVGAVKVFGATQNLRLLNEDDWYAAGAAGFEVLAGGLQPFLEVLDGLRATAKHGLDGPQAVFGRLYQWLAFAARSEASDFDPVRRLIAGHVLRTFPLAKGNVVLGQRVDRRRVHSIRTASIEYGIHPKRLRKLAYAKGLARPTTDHDNLVLLDADRREVEEFLRDAAQQMTLAQTKAYLGTDRVHTKLLINAGFLTAFVGSVSGGLDGMYLRRDLDAFLANLFASAVDVEEPDDDMASIARAASLSNRRAMEIVGAILDKRLNWVGRLIGSRGYPAVLVSVAEVKALLRGPAIDGLTKRDLKEALRCSDGVAAALVEKRQLPSFVALHPVHRCPTTYVPTSAVEDFKKTHVSLFQLASERNEHHIKTRDWLNSKGVKPRLNREDYGAAFFLRSELMP